MQVTNLTDLIAWALIIIGIVIIVAGVASMLRGPDAEITTKRTESKGIILLGPIPIVWGYGRKIWILAALIAVSLFLIFTLW